MDYLSHLVKQLAVPDIAVQPAPAKESLFAGVPIVPFPRVVATAARSDGNDEKKEDKPVEEEKKEEKKEEEKAASSLLSLLSSPVVVPAIVPPALAPKESKRRPSGKPRRSPPPPPPTAPLQLPCRVYVQRTAESMPPDSEDEDRRVYGLFLYADDVTGTGKRFTYQGVRANSVFLFEFPDLEDLDALVYFARPAAAESYIRGTDTGKGWPSIFVDPTEDKDGKPLYNTMADYCGRRCRTLASYVGANKPGFCNDPEFTIEMRDALCLKARERYTRKSRVSVLSELLQREKDKASGTKKPPRKRPRVATPPIPPPSAPEPPAVAQETQKPVEPVVPPPAVHSEPTYPRSVVSQAFRPFAPQFVDAFLHCLDVAMAPPIPSTVTVPDTTPALDDDPFGLRDMPICAEPEKDVFDTDVFD